LARITFSAIISDIRGRLGGHVYSFCRGTHYIKEHNPNPNQPNNESQQFHRNNFSYYSSVWYNLPNTYKHMWRQYASKLKGHLNGFNAFMRHNLRIASANYSGILCMNYPPLSIYEVKYPYPFSITPINSTSNLISWQQPSSPDMFIQPYFNLEWNYSQTFNRHWKMVCTIGSECGSYIHNHSFPIDTVMYYRLRTLHRFAKISPYTHSVTLTVPS